VSLLCLYHMPPPRLALFPTAHDAKARAEAVPAPHLIGYGSGSAGAAPLPLRPWRRRKTRTAHRTAKGRRDSPHRRLCQARARAEVARPGPEASRRGFLMRNAQLVHPLVDGRAGLMERGFQVGHVIRLAVVVGHVGGTVLRAAVPDVGEAALHRGQHVLGSSHVEELVVAGAGSIDRLIMATDGGATPR
jgi:hypothetical protein